MRAATWQQSDVAQGSRRLHLRTLSAPREPDTSAPPLLLLHGLGVSGAVWQSFARRLLPGWRIVAPDLRGHGQSEKPAAGYAPADYAADLAALIPALGVERAPLLGHSLGALAGLALANTRLQRVTALVLLDPPVDETRSNPGLAEVQRLRHAGPGALERYLEDSGRNAPLVAAALAELFRQAAEGVFAEYLAGPQGAPWAWQAAPSLSLPVLVIQADPAAGGLLGDEAAREFVSRLPRGTLVKIHGAPHALHATHPAQVARATVEFLTSPAPYASA